MAAARGKLEGGSRTSWLRRIAHLAVPIAVAVPFGLAHSAPAVAGTATTLGGLQYTAAPGEANHVTFSRNNAGVDVFVDATAVVVAGTGCTQVTQHEADCTPGFGMDGLQADLSDANDAITFSDLATAHVDGGDGDDTIATGTNVCIDDLHGGAGNDTITAAGLGTCGPGDSLYGDAGNDVLNAGSAYDNKLFGGDGADILNGGADPDTLDGGAGPDVLNGGGAWDTADYSSRVSAVTVTIDGVANDGEPGEGDNVKPDVEYLIGGSGDDSLTGSAGANHIEGREGNDTLVGGGENDLVTGGNGNDSIAGGAGDDFIAAGAGDDTESGGDGNDVFSADTSDYGNDTLDGGPGNDRFTSSLVDDADVFSGG